MKKRVNISVEEEVLNSMDKICELWGFNRSEFIVFLFYLFTKAWEKEEEAERKEDNRWCNTCEFKHLESECLGCAEYDEYDNLIELHNYKKEENND